MRPIATPQRQLPRKTPLEVSIERKIGPGPSPICGSAMEVKNLYKMMETASFKALSPKISIYKRLSTLVGSNDNTVTGSVELIKHPKTSDSIKLSGRTSLLKKNIRKLVTKEEYRAPTNDSPTIVPKFLKNDTLRRLKPLFLVRKDGEIPQI